MKLKKSFRVRGSKTLIEAFAKELDNLGLKVLKTMTFDSIGVYEDGNYHMNYPYDCMGHLDESYTLPQDWDKALAAAQDYEVPKVEYVKCLSNKNYYNCTVGKIYKLDEEDKITSDTGVQWGATWRDATPIFEPSTEAEYLKQEAEIETGDYVVMVSDKYTNNSSFRVGDIFRVLNTYKSDFPDVGSWIFDVDHDNVKGMSIFNVRKATEEEIKKAQEIKVGDVVYVHALDEYNNGRWKIGDIFTVGYKSPGISFSGFWVGIDGADGLPDYNVRKATPQEIEIAQTIKVSGYQAEVNNGKIAFGCQHLSKQTLQELHGVASNVDITIGDTKITKDLLTNLINKL